MGLEFKIDDETLLRVLAEKVEFPSDVRDGIVEKVAQKASDNIEKKIPVDKGITKSFFYPSNVRSYIDQAWMTVSFDPKRFGDVGKKGAWKQRSGSNTGWGWGWLGMFNKNNHKNYDWYRPAIAQEKSKIIRELKKEVENYYKNK